jgi:hypothetical protein
MRFRPIRKRCAFSVALSMVALMASACESKSPPPSQVYTSLIGGFDFDGDGKADSISYRYSGGAHCCYYLRVVVGKRPIDLPIEIEGGYMFGLDLSQPQNFNIADFDQDGKSEIMFRILGSSGNPESDLKSAKYKIAEYGKNGFSVRAVDLP